MLKYGLLFRLLTIILVLSSIVIAPLFQVLPAQSTVTTYNHVIPFTITDTSGVARTNLPVIITYDVTTHLLTYGLVNASANDTYIDSSGAGNSPIGNGMAYNFLMSTSNITVVIPLLPAYGSVTVNLYTGYSPERTTFPIIPGNNGYITTASDADLDIGNSGNYTVRGYFDPASTGNLLDKSPDVVVVGCGNGSVKAGIGIFADYHDYFTADTWTDVGTPLIYVSVPNSRIDYDARLSAIDERCYKDFTSTSNTSWTMEFTYHNTSIAGATPVVGFGLWSGAAGWSGYAGDALFVQSYLVGADLKMRIWSYDGGATTQSATITINNGTTYYVRLQRNTAILATLSVFTDAAMTTHVAGSPVTLAIPATVVNLRYAAAANYASGAGAGINLTGWIDNFYLESITTSVTTGSISAGEHTIVVYVNGVNLGIIVDGVSTTTPFAGAIGASGTSFSWITENVMSYCDYITIYKTGVQKLLYEPNALISGTTLPDRVDSGGFENGTITWGTNSNITINGGDIASTQSATSVGETSALLQASLDYMGDYASIYLLFEYGLTLSYGSYTTEVAAVLSQNFSTTLLGLQSNATYHYRALARVGSVYAYGRDLTFTTTPYAYGGGSTEPYISSVNVFRNYATDGDNLFVAEVNCTYPPYYPIYDPRDYFQVQLIDTDGVTILGATPLTYWGDRPCSIYFSPTFVTANLTWGSSYNIRLKGTATTENITEDYNLVSMDWKGYDLTNLDAWCISTAKNMEIIDNRPYGTYVTTITTQGEVISNTAGAYFTVGIPAINTIRPRIFETVQMQPVPDTGTPSNVWDKADLDPAGWRSYVGANFAADIDIMAVPFGINGKDFMMGMVFLSMIGCVIMVVSNTGGFGALGATFITIPLLWLGVYFRIVNIMILIIIVVIMAMLAIRQFVVKTT